MVDWVFVGIGGAGTALGLFFAKRFHSNYKKASERAIEVRQLEESSGINLQFVQNMKREEKIISGLLPHYTTPPKVQSHLRSIKTSYGFKHNIHGQDFQFVYRGRGEFTPIKASLNKCIINPNLLVERNLDGKGVGTDTFSRAKQLAVLGVLGFDIAKKEFYVDCEVIGESARDIGKYFEAKEGTQIVKIIFCVIGTMIGGGLLYYGLKRKKEDD